MSPKYFIMTSCYQNDNISVDITQNYPGITRHSKGEGYRSNIAILHNSNLYEVPQYRLNDPIFYKMQSIAFVTFT